MPIEDQLITFPCDLYDILVHTDTTIKEAVLLRNTILHELTHIIGFEGDALRFFRDDFGGPRKYDEVVQRRGGRDFVVLPRVTANARTHFGAFTGDFPGLRLENNGGSGTKGSHWETSDMGNEIMTGAVGSHAPYSKMTLALLEDSGW